VNNLQIDTEMQRLIAFGCSNTFGHGLPDCFTPETNGPGEEPSKNAWPALLANRFKTTCINKGICGGSNVQILNSILNSSYQQDDVVIVMWADEDRDTVFTSPTDYVQLGHWITDITKRDAYLELNDPYNSIVMSWMYVHHAYLFLKHVGIKFYFLDASQNVHFYLNKPRYASYVEFLKSHFRATAMPFPKALDNLHAGQAAHIEFARILFEEIKNGN